MRSDNALPLTSSPVQPQHIERYQWGSFTGSLVMHGLLLLALPWLLERPELPPPPMEIEVQLEPQPVAAQVQHQYSRAQKQIASTRIVEARPPQVRHKVEPPEALQEMQVELKEVRKRKIKSAGHTIRLASSKMSTATPANKPGTAAQGTAANPGNASRPGPAWQASTLASMPPRPAYAGRQSSIAQALQSKSGEDASPGPTLLTGSTPAVQSVAPEYRHASRPSGAFASQGGARQPAAGLEPRANEARQGSWQSASSSSQAAVVGVARNAQTSGLSAPSRSDMSGSGRPSEGGSNRSGKEPQLALAAAPGPGSSAVRGAATGTGASNRETGPGSVGRGGGSTAAPGEQQSGGLIGSSGPSVAAAAAAAASGTGRPGPDGSAGKWGDGGIGSREGESSGLQLASASSGTSMRGTPGLQRAQMAGGVSPINASFETAEDNHVAMQKVAVNDASARLLEDRYTSTTVKTASPAHICEIPLMMAGLNAKPIPKDLDSIMPSSSAMMGVEFPPQHLPGNQMPVYPLSAIVNNLQGKVVLRVEVLTNGAVGKILLKQSSGARILDTAAYETVKRWHFQPAQRNGQPVVAWMTVPIEYRKPPNPMNGANP
jgi:TonB family protein